MQNIIFFLKILRLNAYSEPKCYRCCTLLDRQRGRQRCETCSMTSCMPPDRELVIIMAVASLCVSSTMCLRQRAPVKLPAHGPIIARVMAGNSGRRSNRTNRSQVYAWARQPWQNYGHTHCWSLRNYDRSFVSWLKKGNDFGISAGNLDK